MYRIILFTAVSLIILPQSAWGKGNTSSKKNERFEIGIGYIPDIQFTPLYVGIEKGFYAEEGIDLIIHHGFAVDVYSLIAQNKLDAGLSDSDKLILGKGDNGLKAFLQYYKDTAVSIVGRLDTINEPRDFIGKKIGTPQPYGSSYIGILLFLKENGITPEEVSIVKIGYSQIPSLLSGQVEGASIYLNNELQKLKLMEEPIKEWNIRDFSPLVGASFIASPKAMAAKRYLYAAFIRATVKSIEYVIKERDDSFEIGSRKVTIDEKSLAQARAVLDATCLLFGSPGEVGEMDRDRYAASIAILQGFDLIDEVFPVDKILFGEPDQ